MQNSGLKKSPINQYLVIEDNPADAELVKAMIEQSLADPADCTWVTRLSDAVKCLTNEKYDSVLLDLNLPDTFDLEGVQEIINKFPETPIVVLTGHNDEKLASQALRLGAQEYLPKDEINVSTLVRCLRYAKERKSVDIQLKNALKESAKRNKMLHKMARHDALTGLPNRGYFENTAIKLLQRANRCQKPLALFYFDLNNFKGINDTLGHNVGDAILEEVARRSQQVVRETDFIARLGGDEFAIITDCLENEAQCYPLVNRLISCFKEPFFVGNHELVCEPSIGVSFFPKASKLSLLIKQADLAMYKAKSDNKSVCFFTDSMGKHFDRELQIRHQLKNAFNRQEFIIEFQRIMPKAGDNRFMAEALTRWHSPTLGTVSPNEFIPILEKSPLHMIHIRAIVNQVSELKQELKNQGREFAYVSINVGVKDIANDTFSKQLITWIDQAGLTPKDICLEITERDIVQNVQRCQDHLNFLRQHGVRITLDDFGAGYASFTQLSTLPIDCLKLDHSLVHNVHENTQHKAINAGIVTMAHCLGAEVIAEGVETPEEYDALIKLGCDAFQGWYFCHSQSREECIRDCEISASI